MAGSHWRLLRTLSVLSCVILMSISTAASAAATPAPQSPEPPMPPSSSAPPSTTDVLPAGSSWAPYPERTVSPMTESGVIIAGGCKYKQANDDPHLSSGDTSIHGWWLRGGGTCPSKANVDVYLQAYGCGPFGCQWITVDSGSGDYVPGPGSGKWANARLQCSSTAVVGWRGYTDVDLPGIIDPSGVTYSTIRNLACSPPG